MSDALEAIVSSWQSLFMAATARAEAAEEHVVALTEQVVQLTRTLNALRQASGPVTQAAFDSYLRTTTMLTAQELTPEQQKQIWCGIMDAVVAAVHAAESRLHDN